MKKRICAIMLLLAMLNTIIPLNAFAAGPVWPLDRSKITKEWKNWYSYTINGKYMYHAGTDFATKTGNNVYATYDGVVDFAGWYDPNNHSKSYGLYVILKCNISGNVRYIYFGHLSQLSVKKGDYVTAGQVIGKSGSTGFSTGPHLHYEVRNQNKYYGSLSQPGLNPYDYLPGGIVQNVSKPATPSSVNISSSNLAIGDSITASWGAVSGATGYDVKLNCTTNSAYNQSMSVTGTKATFVLNNAGTYNISVSAKNSAGSSSTKTSSSTVVHPNCTVTFKDYDNTILEVKSVKYGGTVSGAAAPSREGYTFQGWNQGLLNITSDKNIVATYSINTYTVKFVDNEGRTLSSQRINYKESATEPNSPTPPSGYMFVGWDKEDYKSVTKDLTITAVFAWENVDLPIVASISSAKRNEEANGYEISVNLKNYPNSLTRGKIVAMLKTEAGKMVASETETFNLQADATSNKTIYVPYSGVATVADVAIVGVIDDGNTGVPIANSVNSPIDLGLEWSDWSENVPPQGDYITESRTEYRYKDKQTTTSSSNTMAGWTLYDTKRTSWGSTQGPVYYDPSNGIRNVWDERYVSSTTTYYKYYHRYTGSVWGSDSTAPNSPRHSCELTYSLSATGYQAAGIKFYGSYTCPNCKAQRMWIPEGTRTQNNYSTRWYYQEPVYTYYFYKWSDWSDWSTTERVANDNKQVESRTVYRFKSNDIKLSAYNYKRYKYQNLNNGNFYYTYDPTYADSMGYPGEWEYNKVYSELSKIATVEDGIELYGGYGENSWYKADINNLGNNTDYVTYDTLEDTSGKKYTISGQISAPNKKATLMVYKGTNTDPTASQLEYVEQTTLDNEGNYSFVVNPKEIPSIKTGDFIAVIGIEGSTAPIYVDTIYAPLPTYNVEFVDEDGSILNKQTVIEGDAAELPATNPSKEGYEFVGWDTGIKNVHSDLTIKAQYKKNTYTVVFVDWENNDIDIKTFEHGDYLTGPTPTEKDGHSFKGWDVALNGNTTVTQNMIVSAVYDINKYTISFANWDGEIIDTQVVEYGEEVELPEEPTMDGMVFAGWSDSQVLMFASQDITVYPIFEYTESCQMPAASIKSGSYSGTQNVELTCSTSNSKIYYSILLGEDNVAIDTLDLSALEWTEYTTPIQISDDCILVSYANAENMNNSIYIIEDYKILGTYTSEITGSTLKRSNGNISGKLYYNVVGEGNSISATPIVSVYDANDKFIYLKMLDPITLVEGDNVGNISDINFKDSSNQYTIKLFFWDSLTNLKPVSNVSIFEY